MDVCCECCMLWGRGLCDELISSRGVLPTVMRRCVWSRNLKNEEAMARVGSQRHKIKKYGVRPTGYCWSYNTVHRLAYISWAANNHSTNYEISRLLRNPKFSTVLSWPRQTLSPGQINTVHTLYIYVSLSKVIINITIYTPTHTYVIRTSTTYCL